MIITPTAPTLKRYGLTEDDWDWLVAEQLGACGLCGNIPPSGRLYIDHEHVYGFKKLPPEERRKHVRGGVCFVCNTRRIARNDARTARALVEYFERRLRTKLDGDQRGALGIGDLHRAMKREVGTEVEGTAEHGFEAVQRSDSATDPNRPGVGNSSGPLAHGDDGGRKNRRTG